eukprot:1852696-Rhodomonas_salina.1
MKVQDLSHTEDFGFFWQAFGNVVCRNSATTELKLSVCEAIAEVAQESGILCCQVAAHAQMQLISKGNMQQLFARVVGGARKLSSCLHE